jgi:hypothetical protein
MTSQHSPYLETFSQADKATHGALGAAASENKVCISAGRLDKAVCSARYGACKAYSQVQQLETLERELGTHP